MLWYSNTHTHTYTHTHTPIPCYHSNTHMLWYSNTHTHTHTHPVTTVTHTHTHTHTPCYHSNTHTHTHTHPVTSVTHTLSYMLIQSCTPSFKPWLIDLSVCSNGPSVSVSSVRGGRLRRCGRWGSSLIGWGVRCGRRSRWRLSCLRPRLTWRRWSWTRLCPGPFTSSRWRTRPRSRCCCWAFWSWTRPTPRCSSETKHTRSTACVSQPTNQETEPHSSTPPGRVMIHISSFNYGYTLF